jgi:hypothetical protein
VTTNRWKKILEAINPDKAQLADRDFPNAGTMLFKGRFALPSNQKTCKKLAKATLQFKTSLFRRQSCGVCPTSKQV